MKRIPGILSFAMLASLINVSISTAQEQKTLTFSPESKITVDGTSNRDNWTVIAPEFEGSVTIVQNSGDSPEFLEAQLAVKTQDMTGGRGSIMDRLMLNALKANQHPDIIFTLTDVESVPDDENPQVFQVKSTGELTIAGVTQTIEVELQGQQLEDGSYRFQGSRSLLMRDYDIEPPTAMFGALVTGNEVVINLEILTDDG